MDREEAINLVKQHIKKDYLFKHILAVEAIMKGMAKHFGEDEELWGLVGLLHDVDYEKTAKDPKNHGIMAEEFLKDKVDDKIIHAVKSHNPEYTGIMPETKMEKALVAADAVSGLIVAAALILPSKKLSDVKVESVGKRFKEKDFARRCSRENMLICEEIGIPKEKFFEIALTSMQEISNDLGL
jgi:putative nucleotidyltransferase with HDIG domain